jgi:hypothetical protein
MLYYKTSIQSLEIVMSFSFVSQHDADIGETLGKLIKFNNGFFKSLAQSKFFQRVARIEESRSFRDIACESRGVPTPDAEDYILAVTYSVRWADYGTKSVRLGEYFFVVDKYGVKSQYKVSLHGIEVGGGVIKEKTKKMWERDTTIPLPSMEEPIDTRVNEHVGEVGAKKFVVEGTVKKIHEHFGEAAYFTTYTAFIHVEDADGRLIILKSSKAVYDANDVLVVEGSKIKFQGTIIDHGEYKGRKQTTLNRCKVLEHTPPQE